MFWGTTGILQGLVNVPFWGFVSYHLPISVGDAISPFSWVMRKIGTFTNPWRVIYIPFMYHLYTNCVPFMYHLCTNYIPIMYHLCTIYIPIRYHFLIFSQGPHSLQAPRLWRPSSKGWAVEPLFAAALKPLARARLWLAYGSPWRRVDQRP